MATEYQKEPTVVPFPGFHPSTDAKTLRAAMKGFGTNENAIIDLLCNRSNDQRQKIIRAFKLDFGRDLLDDLESELRGKLEQLILALMDKPNTYLAKELHKAMKGIGCDTDSMTEILCTRTNAELKQIAIMYEKLYNKSLEKAIESEVSGDYRSLLILLLSVGQSGARDESGLYPDKAKEQAEKLYASGEGQWGTNEEVFVVLLAHQSLGQLRLIFKEYEKLSSKTLLEAVEAEFSGKLKTAITTIVKCAMGKTMYYAERLENAMKGIGCDDDTLIRVVVTRCEIDLGNIKAVYEQMYGKSLYSAVESETSGDYRKAILQLIKE